MSERFKVMQISEFMAQADREERAARAAWEKRYPDAARDLRQRNNTIEMQWARKLLKGARQRGRPDGEYGLSMWHILGALYDGRCQATGAEFDFEGGLYGPSLDRINPGAGYFRDNVQVVTWMFNRSKNDLRADEFDALCRARLRQLGEIGASQTSQAASQARER